jgi:hypothetical protein
MGSWMTERTLEFIIDVADMDAHAFSERLMDDFEGNPLGVRHFGGHMSSAQGEVNYSRAYINVIFTEETAHRAAGLLDYLKGRGYECGYKQDDPSS